MEPADINLYKQQLVQINGALQHCEESQREELLILKNNIEELLALTNENEDCSNETDDLSDEYALFMAELKTEGAFTQNSEKNTIEKLENIEGKKCRAPHEHQFGNVAYHNAMVCSAFEDEDGIKVRVLFTNPTHQEMLPCPYYYESECRFSDDKCHFSHGETVLYSSLKDYVEPRFDQLNTGSFVLAKQDNNLWYRAVVQKVYDNKCLIKFECNKKIAEVLLEHVFPLDNGDEECDVNSDIEDVDVDREDIINMSLMVTPSNQAMGDWEKHTKGIGSKLMAKMGYIIGTGLGKNAEGRIDPVTAVILPAGKSLDHCMKLREQAGGDKNLFSVERKLKRLQRKQQRQNERVYEQQCKQKNVFDFINNTLAKTTSTSITNDRRALKEESHRNLNIEDFKITENMKKIEDNLVILKNSLNRQTDKSSKTHQHIVNKIRDQEHQYQIYQKQAQMIKNEMNLRNDRKKLTEF